jgi:hypothetical protein
MWHEAFRGRMINESGNREAEEYSVTADLINLERP